MTSWYILMAWSCRSESATYGHDKEGLLACSSENKVSYYAINTFRTKVKLFLSDSFLFLNYGFLHNFCWIQQCIYTIKSINWLTFNYTSGSQTSSPTKINATTTRTSSCLVWRTQTSELKTLLDSSQQDRRKRKATLPSISSWGYNLFHVFCKLWKVFLFFRSLVYNLPVKYLKDPVHLSICICHECVPSHFLAPWVQRREEKACWYSCYWWGKGNLIYLLRLVFSLQPQGKGELKNVMVPQLSSKE